MGKLDESKAEVEHKTRPVSMIQLSSWDDFEDRVKDYFSKEHPRVNYVLLRHFQSDRLPTLLATGSDRDKGSYVWQTEAEKNSGRTALSDPGLLIYANIVDIQADPINKFVSGYNGPEKSVAIYSAFHATQTDTWDFRFPSEEVRQKALIAVVCFKKVE